MNELELATDEELITELANRWPHLLVVGQRDTRGDEDATDFEVAYRGGLTTAIGLAERARHQMCRGDDL